MKEKKIIFYSQNEVYSKRQMTDNQSLTEKVHIHKHSQTRKIVLARP